MITVESSIRLSNITLQRSACSRCSHVRPLSVALGSQAGQ